MGAFMSFKATRAKCPSLRDLEIISLASVQPFHGGRSCKLLLDTALHYSVRSGNELYEERIHVPSACTEKGNSDHDDYF